MSSIADSAFIRAVIALLLDGPKPGAYVKNNLPPERLPKRGKLHFSNLEKVVARGMLNFTPRVDGRSQGLYGVTPLGRKWYEEGGEVPKRRYPKGSGASMAASTTGAPVTIPPGIQARYERAMIVPIYVPEPFNPNRPGAMDAYNIPTLDAGTRRPYRPPMLLSSSA